MYKEVVVSGLLEIVERIKEEKKTEALIEGYLYISICSTY